MQMAKFLLVAFATAAVISITLGAGKHVDVVTTRANIRISNLLDEETIWSCCCSYFFRPKYLLLRYYPGDRGFASIAATYVKHFRREESACP